MPYSSTEAEATVEVKGAPTPVPGWVFLLAVGGAVALMAIALYKRR